MIDIVIAWDSTGSMYSCLHEVKRRVTELVDRIYEIQGARIALYSFGNYCDKPNILHSLQELCGVAGKEKVVGYLKNVPSTRGGGHYKGGCPACYELAMQAAKSLDWQQDKRIMIVIGDEVPSDPNEGEYHRMPNVDWAVEYKALVEKGVHFYGVHCLNSSTTKKWYQHISQKSDGTMVSLSQFGDIVEILHAICYKEQGMTELERFEAELKNSNKMTRSLANVFASLSGKSVSDIVDYKDYSSCSPTDLKPVDPSRFQVLGVVKDQDIKSFVVDSGARFRIGNGFYEWTKRETIQEQKEVVLVDRITGDMWSGAAARDMLGLPFGQRDDLSPTTAHKVLSEYKVYIQSTSNNRKLTKNTKFLYEVERK